VWNGKTLHRFFSRVFISELNIAETIIGSPDEKREYHNNPAVGFCMS
jgi:hypothetical protein